MEEERPKQSNPGSALLGLFTLGIIPIILFVAAAAFAVYIAMLFFRG